MNIDVCDQIWFSVNDGFIGWKMEKLTINEGINGYTELNLGNQKWICTMESREYAEKSLSRQTLH